MKKIPVLIISAFLLFSCGRQPLEQFKYIPALDWHYNQPVSFDVNIGKPGNYRMYIQIRYTMDYSFSNIWTSIQKTNPDGKTEKVRYNISLFDLSGRPEGSFAGKYFDRSFPDAETDEHKLILTFDKAGTYKLTLQHNMRIDDLMGIKELGIRLEPEM